MAEAKTSKKAKKKPASRRRKEPESCGLRPQEVAGKAPPAAIQQLETQISEADGVVLARYREPLGGSWLLLAALPVSRVAPTPFQRDLSDAHVKRLENAIGKLGSFLDPLIAVPAPQDSGEVRFWTPNGYHRLSSLQRLGARTVTALISPDPALAYRILVLNTEKAHGTKERSLEAVRMARGLADLDPARLESEFALELEDGSLVTLGCAYQARPRFAGGAYAPALKASDAFLELPIGQALELRDARAERLLGIEERVAEIMKELKEQGFESPYLRNFIVARIRPFRPRGKPAPGPDALLDHMEKAAAKFDPAKVRSDQIARSAAEGSE
jgi:ParB family chromosome partitioning protein